MRIGIDGYNLAMPHGTGVATYARETVLALHAMGHEVEGIFGLAVPQEIALRETAFFEALTRPPRQLKPVGRLQRGWRTMRSLYPPKPREVPLSTAVEKGQLADDFPTFDRLVTAARLFDDAYRFFRATGRFLSLRLVDPPDIMHWTYPVPVVLADVPNIYTLHDLVPLKLPYATLDDKTLYARMIEGCARSAAQLCTVSRSSKADIVARFGVETDRITITYQATTTAARSGSTPEGGDAASIAGIFGFEPRGYFLYFGAIEPKKNVGRLIEAYLSMRTTTPLVIVGARSWRSESELQLVPDGGADGAAGTFHGPRGHTIVRLRYLPRPLLSKLVGLAKAVVFPSLYEGFGLPVLEAMQLGTPVITSTTSSLPEVAGEAALLVDPYNVGAIRDALVRLDDDPVLGDAMAARGREQALFFSSERYQQRLGELYAAALEHRP